MHNPSVARETIENPKVVVKEKVAALRAAPIVAGGIHEGMVEPTAVGHGKRSTIVPGAAAIAESAQKVCVLINCNASTYFHVLHLL